MKLHRLSGPALITKSHYMMGEIPYYFIDGVHMEFESFQNNNERKKYFRRKKLKRII